MTFDNDGNELKKIVLVPLNKEYEPIILEDLDEDAGEEFKIVGEFVGLL